MLRPNEREFLQQVLETLKDPPPGLAQRFSEILGGKDVDRAQAIRQLFEDLGGD